MMLEICILFFHIYNKYTKKGDFFLAKEVWVAEKNGFKSGNL